MLIVVVKKAAVEDVFIDVYDVSDAGVVVLEDAIKFGIMFMMLQFQKMILLMMLRMKLIVGYNVNVQD